MPQGRQDGLGLLCDETAPVCHPTLTAMTDSAWFYKGTSVGVRWGDLVYEEGDFVVMAKESTHPRVHSVRGNLLLIMAGHNELVRGG
jgi:hypothetical protein